ncbi:bacteriohemerythrin [Paenibacillus mesotrionivorans]|jgi:hemerythrin|uniref:Bacteriohemerythrin n=1 Tax=Paenibacillus mesotrionivorans TaxID=3160968 RepID=A0ACC7NYF8_9BACL
MISWRETYNIGVDEVDQQHQELVVKLNEFLDACIQQKGKDKIMETLAFLRDYTVEHFRSEEEIMLKYNYPEYAEHKKDHDDFVASVLELEASIQNQGATVVTTLKLNRTLTDWLLSHISKSDMKIGQFLRINNIV